MRQKLGVWRAGDDGEEGWKPAQIVGGSRKPEVEAWNATGGQGSGGCSRETLRGSLCLPAGVALGGPSSESRWEKPGT